MNNEVLIMNFHSKTSRDVARMLRAEQIRCRVVSKDLSFADTAAMNPMGLILAGGSTGVMPSGLDTQLLQGSWPILAIGDAAGLLCRCLGGDALGISLMDCIDTVHFFASPVTERLDDCERMLHNVRSLRLGDNMIRIASCGDEIIGFCSTGKAFYGLQFGLEANDTDGAHILLNFVIGVCGCTREWSEASVVRRAEEQIRSAAGDGPAVCAMTGGLDSGLCALLAHRALGDRLKCVFINTGLMRMNEVESFLRYFRDQEGLNIKVVEAADLFLNVLAGVTAPAAKNRIVGSTLQELLNRAASDLAPFCTVLRSTTCDDILRGADVDSRPGLKTESPACEPLRDLFKDEIRSVGEYLGMPEEFYSKQTLPASGLSTWIIGEVTASRLQTLRECDAVFCEQMRADRQARKLYYHAMLMTLPGNDTQCGILLRAQPLSGSGRLQYPARLPYELLEQTADLILKRRPEVARVFYDLGGRDVI